MAKAKFMNGEFSAKFKGKRRSFIAAKERYVSGKRSLHVWILFRGNMIF